MLINNNDIQKELVLMGSVLNCGKLDKEELRCFYRIEGGTTS